MAAKNPPLCPFNVTTLGPFINIVRKNLGSPIPLQFSRGSHRPNPPPKLRSHPLPLPPDLIFYSLKAVELFLFQLLEYCIFIFLLDSKQYIIACLWSFVTKDLLPRIRKKYYFLQWCPIRMRIFHWNESCLLCSLLPSNKRSTGVRMAASRKLSF